MQICRLLRTFGSRAGLTAMLCLTSALVAQEPIRLQERFAVGCQYHVSSRVELTGTLSPPSVKDQPKATPLEVRGDSAIEYDERVLAIDSNGTVDKTARLCRRTDFQRTVGGRPQSSTLRPNVRRLVILRKDSREVPFSPDGPMTWSEIDLIRTDVFSPALVGLCSDRAVKPNDTWLATESAVRELTDLEKIDEGKVECRLEQITVIEGRKLARVALSGTVRGINEDGPNRQQLDGYFYFDLESNHLSYLYLKGRHAMLDRDGNEVGRVEGRFVMTRRVNTHCPELSDERLRGVGLEPTADNTLLLYDNPSLGLKFLHARRWHVASSRGSQVALDSADGSGLVISLDPPSRAPTALQFRDESRDWLIKQKARIAREESVRTVRDGLEQFAIEADLAGQTFLMDYFVSRQAAGGATLAARLLSVDRAALRAEVERLARSVELSSPEGGR